MRQSNDIRIYVHIHKLAARLKILSMHLYA